MNRPVVRKQKKSKITRSESYVINAKYIGDEPEYDLSIPLTQKQYGDAFNWYNYMCTVSDAREYIQDYLSFLERNIDVASLKKVPDVHINTTSGWIARLCMNGYITPDGSLDFFEKKLKESFSKIKQEPTAIVVNIQDRMKQKTSDLIADIESRIDHGEFSLYDYLKENNTPATYCSEIISNYSLVLNELLEASEKTDNQLVEAYSHMNKKQMDARITSLNSLISDAEKYSSNVKKTRVSKPRTIKTETILKTFKYQKEDKQNKLASIAPEKILGAQELWTFNTKYKTLTVYRANGPNGLSIKGTSIIGFDETTSLGKSVGRKQEDYLRRVMIESKFKLKKIFDEITTANVFTNRTSDNTILLKVT